ncbi:MAG: N-acetylmuramoyl-L-alanine amidase [Pseudomonadota bacterium]
MRARHFGKLRIAFVNAKSVFVVSAKPMRAFSFALSALAGLITASSLPTASSAADLLGVRFGERAANKTRIVIDLDGPVKYTLAGDDEGAGRLHVKLAGAGAEGIRARNGLGSVKRFTVSSDSDATRLVFSMARSAKVENHFTIPPRNGVKKHRLVIDLTNASEDAFLASVPRRYETVAEVLKASDTVTGAPAAVQADVPEKTAAAPAARVAATPTLRPQTLPAAPVSPAPVPPKPARYVVVIDAGHGGGDPGAIGASGIREKAVTLAAAKALRDRLATRDQRYTVVMTRKDDERLALHQRARLARDAKPDLFISLHADAHSNKKLRGGSVYTLSQEGAKRSAREAQRQENFVVGDLDMSEVEPELGKILYDFAQRETINASSRFAEVLLAQLNGVTPLLNNSHRKEDLRVLLAPDVPAVLLELAFISNKQDEANLKSPKWRRKTAEAVAVAIDKYFAEKEELQRQSGLRRSGLRRSSSNSG